MIEEALSFTEILQKMLVDFLALLPSLIAALVVFGIGLYVASLMRRLARKGLERRTKNPQPVTLLSQLTYWLVVIFVAAISLQMVGFNLTAFLAGLGIAGITIGFALQDVSKNFIAGVLMLIQQPFDVGELIEVDRFTGKVEALDLRATQIRTLDGKLVLIPNGQVMVSAITNYSRAPARRVAISTGVAYESEPGYVHQTAIDAIANIEGLLSEPAPEVLFEGFGSTTMDLTIYFWIDTSKTNVAKATDAGLLAVKMAFEQAKIDMPLPAQSVFLMQ